MTTKTKTCEAWTVRDETCRLTAKWSFIHAPNGTSQRRRETMLVCTRHKNIIQSHNYPYGAMIMVSGFEPIQEVKE